MTESTTPKIGNLIPCPTCGHSIAASAATCPSCGARNTYVHPLITEFKARSWATMPQFFFDHTPTTMTFTAHRLAGPDARNNSGMAAAAGGGIIVFLGLLMGEKAIAITLVGGIALVIGLIVMAFTMGEGAGTNPANLGTRAFVDLGVSPPRWESDDDSFWHPIKTFFLTNRTPSPPAGQADAPPGSTSPK